MFFVILPIATLKCLFSLNFHVMWFFIKSAAAAKFVTFTNLAKDFCRPTYSYFFRLFSFNFMICGFYY